jgi:hypothetical protein
LGRPVQKLASSLRRSASRTQHIIHPSIDLRDEPFALGVTHTGFEVFQEYGEALRREVQRTLSAWSQSYVPGNAIEFSDMCSAIHGVYSRAL